jgi:acetolactate synthase I/III small subunit
MKHIISALVMNHPGVLAHIAGLFSARGFNIDSLAVGETELPGMSRMTIVVDGDDAVLEQVRKQLGTVIDVVKIQDFSGQRYVARDLALIRVNAPVARRSEIIELAGIFRAGVVDVGPNEVMIEIAGSEDKIEAFVQILTPYGIKELARTGRIALARAVQT